MGKHSRPESEQREADKKWAALRKAGYTGPIDHNGDPVNDMGSWLDRFLGRDRSDNE